MAYDSSLSTLRQSSINSIAMENGPFIKDLLFQMVLFLVFRRKLLDWQRAHLHPSPLGVSDLQEVLWQQHDERFAGLGARGRERGTGAQPSPAQPSSMKGSPAVLHDGSQVWNVEHIDHYGAATGLFESSVEGELKAGDAGHIRGLNLNAKVKSKEINELITLVDICTACKDINAKSLDVCNHVIKSGPCTYTERTQPSSRDFDQ